MEDLVTWVTLASGLWAGHPGPRFGCLFSGTGKFAVEVGCRDSHICWLSQLLILILNSTRIADIS